jgi:hypothetical protein
MSYRPNIALHNLTLFILDTPHRRDRSSVSVLELVHGIAIEVETSSSFSPLIGLRTFLYSAVELAEVADIVWIEEEEE